MVRVFIAVEDKARNCNVIYTAGGSNPVGFWEDVSNIMNDQETIKHLYSTTDLLKVVSELIKKYPEHLEDNSLLHHKKCTKNQNNSNK